MSKEIYQRRPVLGDCKASRFPYLPARILKISRESFTGFSHIFSATKQQLGVSLKTLSWTNTFQLSIVCAVDSHLPLPRLPLPLCPHIFHHPACCRHCGHSGSPAPYPPGTLPPPGIGICFSRCENALLPDVCMAKNSFRPSDLYS